MAHLWLCESSGGDAWEMMPLDDDAVAVLSAVQLRRAAGEPDTWTLIGPPRVRVNGHPLDAGIRVLRDRDELRVGGRRAFFSTETLAMVVPFPGERPTLCPRCKLEILPGSPAVRCPQCGIWHHQSEEFPCWLYSSTCTNCDQLTALDAHFRWSPETL